MTELFVFKTARRPEFLSIPSSDETLEGRSEQYKSYAKAFLGTLRSHNPEADYPYMALMIRNIGGKDMLYLVRPDSSNLGGIRGPLKAWNYPADNPDGLARMIHEDRSRPQSPHPHMNPITCVVDFDTNNSVFDEAYRLLKNRHGYDVKIIDIV